MDTMEKQNFLPKDFVNKMKKLLGDEFEQFEHCYLNEKYQGIRFNPLKEGLEKKDYETILKELDILEIKGIPWEEQAYYYGTEARPGKHFYHEAGLYYIQEPSAMSAAALLNPKPGERVLDLCAAPGGKTTQLAGYMKQEGILVANEIHSARCKILSQNVERLGIRNVVVTNEESGKLAKSFPKYFHKILVDAPCSGEGMFRKNQEACAEWSLEQVKVCADRQLEILENAAEMLVEGGLICYSTCTFSPEENECLIARFLKNNPQFHVEKAEMEFFNHGKPEWADGNSELFNTFRLWPHHLHGEGHFAALLRKDISDEMEEHHTKKTRKSDNKVLDKNMMAVLQEFLTQTVTKKVEEWVLDGNLILFGEQLYRLPEGMKDIKGIRILRAGLHIGTFKKNRFEPAHAFALALGTNQVKQVISLESNSTQAAQYMKGETIETELKKGWCLVCLNEYSIGWGKVAAGVLKNHYPKGLRREN